MNRIVQTIVFAGTAAVIALALFLRVDLVNRGGPVMMPIIMCSIFSMALILERVQYFFGLRLGAGSDRRFRELRSQVESHRWNEAVALCRSWQGAVGRVALAGLAARNASPQEIDETMEEAAHEEMPRVERHLRWLSTLAQVSTLLGLLGTVTGLVRAFQIIQTKSATGNPVSPGDLAGGVWEALITTVAGLTVAIPTILAYNYLASRVGEVQFQMEKAASLLSGWRQARPTHAAE